MLQRLFVFIVRNDVWMLLLLGVACAWYLLQIALRRRELRRSAFRLERERAVADRNSALLFLALCLALAGGIGYVNRSIRPTLDPALLYPPTPQPDQLATAVAEAAAPRLTPRPAIPTATPPLVPTATLRNPAAVGDLLPTTPTAPPLVVEPFTEGCGPDILISAPTAGNTVAGGVSLFGRARGSDFGYYTIEINGPFTNALWVSLLDNVVQTPVENGFLGNADLTGWTNGVYQIRLTVLGTDEAEQGSCLIQVGINNP